MKINGYEVKLKQIWERGNGDLAVITKFEDTIFPICILMDYYSENHTVYLMENAVYIVLVLI